jgi:hypothetical protein
MTDTHKDPNPANKNAANPAQVATAKPTEERRRRIPMSAPVRRLEVEEIPGYRTYWFRESNVIRAQAAGYEFVNKEDVKLLSIPVASNPGGDGNTDLGTHVSIVAGTTEHGQPERLVLMKIKREWFREDQRELAEMNAKRLESIFGGEVALDERGQISDRGRLVYVDPSRTSLMNRRGRKAPRVSRS